MIHRLINPHFKIAAAFKWMVVPLLVMTLALATTFTIDSNTAFADTGTGTETISAPNGDPSDCWWAGLPCLIFGIR